MMVKMRMQRMQRQQLPLSTKRYGLPSLHLIETKDDIDAYLQRYEKVAEVNKWPETDWALHLSTLLTGQALSAVCTLTSRRVAGL